MRKQIMNFMSSLALCRISMLAFLISSLAMSLVLYGLLSETFTIKFILLLLVTAVSFGFASLYSTLSKLQDYVIFCGEVIKNHQLRVAALEKEMTSLKDE